MLVLELVWFLLLLYSVVFQLHPSVYLNKLYTCVRRVVGIKSDTGNSFMLALRIPTLVHFCYHYRIYDTYCTLAKDAE